MISSMFFFSDSVFKSFLSQGHFKSRFCGKGLIENILFLLHVDLYSA